MAPKRAGSKRAAVPKRVAAAPKRGAARGASSAANRDLVDAGGAVERLLTHLSLDELALILFRLPLAHDIALTASACRLLRDAARLAFKARPYIGKVVSLVHTEKFIVAAHRNDVFCVAAAADGRVITGSMDRSIKVWRSNAEPKWSAVGKRTVLAMHMHRAAVNAVAVLPDRARFVSVSDRTAMLCALDGAVERTTDMQGYVYCVAALPDGVHFVVGVGYDLKLYHVDGTLVHTFKGHTFTVLAVAVARDGQHIISGSTDHRVKVWSVATKSLVGECIGHNSAVLAVAVMPDGKRILSGSNDRTVRRWLLDGTQTDTFRLHTGGVCALVALPDNKHALSAAGGHDTAKLFNVNDGAVLRTFKHYPVPVRCLALLPDGLRFVSGSVDGSACIVEHGLAPH
jgi:WD40 repeat protein